MCDGDIHWIEEWMCVKKRGVCGVYLKCGPATLENTVIVH